MKKFKAAFGTILSIAAVGLLLVLFWWICNLANNAMNAPTIIPSGTATFLGAAAALIGMFWAAWAYGYLLFIGRGSPAELFGYGIMPTSRLVTTGPYGFTRNPFAFGILWLLLGVALFSRSLSGIILVPILALLGIFYLRLFEEPQLERRFGEEYHCYRQNVPLLFPRFRALVTGEPSEPCDSPAEEL